MMVLIRFLVELNGKRTRRSAGGMCFSRNLALLHPHLTTNSSRALSVAPIWSAELRAIDCSIRLKKVWWHPMSLHFKSTSSSLLPPALRSYEISSHSLPHQIFVTFMMFSVSVPVLSEQMLSAPPMISQAARRFTSLWSFAIFPIE